MAIEFGLTDDHFNTKYAPLAALAIAYQRYQMLEPLQNVKIRMKTREIEAQTKLKQALVSILAGCETLSEVNTKLRPEIALAQAWGWPRIVDQSTLSRTVNALTQMNIEELRGANVEILRRQGRSLQHDWRGYLRLDFDLSGLASSAKAECSEKGYFSGKKTRLGAN